MKMLKIETFENNTKDATIKIPIGIVKIASKLIPNKHLAPLNKNKVSLDELIEAASHPEVDGQLIGIEDHNDGERVVISVE